MAQFDFETLDPSTVVPVMFEGVAYVKLPSVAAVFGGQVTLETVAEAFVTSPSDIVHEVVHNELNVDALKVLYEQARRDDVDPPATPSAPGRKPFPRRRQRDPGEEPHDRRWMMGEEVLKIAGVIVHEGAEQHFRCARWELGAVTLWLPLAEGLRQWLVKQDVCEPQQRAVYACTPKRDSFTALQNTCTKLREGAAHLKACTDALKQTVDPLMKGIMLLARGRNLLEVVDSYPEGDPRDRGQRLEIGEYRACFEKLYEACLEGVAKPNRYGLLATFWRTEREAADELIACLRDEQLRQDVEALCGNQALAPPSLAAELWKSFDMAYGALVLSSRAGEVLEDLLEYLEAMSSGLSLDPATSRGLKKMHTEWLSRCASSFPEKSSRAAKSALGALAKASELWKKGGEALQGLAMGGGALAYMRWQPVNGGSLPGLRPANGLMRVFFRTLVRINALSTDEILEKAKALDALDWESYRKAKGFAGNVASGRAVTGFKTLFALAGVYLIWKGAAESGEIGGNDWGKIAKLFAGIAKDTLKVNDEAISKCLSAIMARQTAKESVKLASGLLEALGAVIAVSLAIQSLAEDWQNDFGDRELSIVHGFAAIAGFAALADLMVATAWLGPVAWILGLGAGIAEIALVANKSYATLVLEDILEEFQDSDAWHVLVTRPREGREALARTPALPFPEMPFREAPLDAVERAYRTADKRKFCDCGEVHPSLAANLGTIGFEPKVIQFMTGEKNFLWAEVKDQGSQAWGKWCELVTLVK